jgi:hypothetical protein
LFFPIFVILEEQENFSRRRDNREVMGEEDSRTRGLPQDVAAIGALLGLAIAVYRNSWVSRLLGMETSEYLSDEY